MERYSFCVPEIGSQVDPIFMFDLIANSREQAVQRAKQLIFEMQNDQGFVPVETDFGISNGKVRIKPDTITDYSIFKVTVLNQPF